MSQYEELASRVVDLTMKMGASNCDVLVCSSSYISAEIEKGSMKQSSAVSDPGVAIRAFVDGCQGFSSCTGHLLGPARKSAALAVSLAKAGTPDKDFKGLPDKKRPTRISGLFDPRIPRLESDEIVSMAIDLAGLASNNRKITSVNASVAAAEAEFSFANSNGFVGSQKLTSFELSAEAVARSGSAMFSGVDGAWSRRLDEPMIRTVGESSSKHAVLGLRQKRVRTGDYPIVMDPLAAGFILSSAIGGGVNAESIQRKRSYLAGKLGRVVASDILTVHDDPTLEWANGSYGFDGEGTPSFRKPIIEKGVLRNYLHDSYTAGKDSVPSTGNASRGGSTWSHRRPPAIAPSNLVVGKGDALAEELIAETRSGVYLRLTWDHPNLATGEFSGMMMESFEIVHGELGPSLRQATLGINILDMLARVDIIGKESRDAFGTRTPPIRVSRARVGGSGA